jgi:AcrR family transcriptional regulator
MAPKTAAKQPSGGTRHRAGKPYAAVPDAGTREQVVRVAIELFLQRGYEGTSLKAIATEIGISTPALYWHFPSKQDIFFAALEQILDDFLETVRNQLMADSPRERLAELVTAHVRFQLERQPSAEIYQTTFGFKGQVQQLPAEYRRRILERQRSYMHEVRDILHRGREQGDFAFEDLAVTAFAVIQLCDYPTSWYDADGRLSPEEIAELFVGLTLRMVGGTTLT